MKLSIYTFVRNGLYFDFHVEAMLRHHLPLADEIIVNEGYSTDGTFEAIKDLDPKIKIFRNELDRSDPASWSMKSKNWARQQCTGDWCILLDADEFIPEWEFDRLRETLENAEQDILVVRFRHFYANYRLELLQDERKLPPRYGARIHRNLQTIAAWGDGANVKLKDGSYEIADHELAVECHHFGGVRNAARLRQKWRAQARRHWKDARWDWVPGFVFDLFPHRWDDEDLFPRLRIYDGPLIEAVRKDPDEFVRDKFRLLKMLEQQTEAAAAE